ncbi:MAG: hydrogenase maturation nickel metallochaperone HypA [Gammaproteobacteria bacterium]|nr:hydrogenase maturation nickel metallochaperone HypA [Gammaproteobacteria bacterium]NNK31953.1 hydrogenase maturation nickel metallochaperone HypA [Xanthomonadales bacterium]
MHELSVCQGLLRQVDRLARENGADAVTRIVLRIGGLSGVEPPLLQHAFEIARMGTLAQEAELAIEEGPVVVKCQECGGRSVVPVNRLLCTYCGEWKVNVVEGEELLLLSLDLDMPEAEAPAKSENAHV